MKLGGFLFATQNKVRDRKIWFVPQRNNLHSNYTLCVHNNRPHKLLNGLNTLFMNKPIKGPKYYFIYRVRWSESIRAFSLLSESETVEWNNFTTSSSSFRSRPALISCIRRTAWSEIECQGCFKKPTFFYKPSLLKS